MSSNVNNYKIYCNTEAVYISGWGLKPPSTCYNNNTHDVNVNSVQLLSTVTSNEVTIKEDKIQISRNTKIIQIPIIDVLPGESATVDYLFPINMSMYVFDYTANEDSVGDLISIHANPDTVLGLIGADMLVGDNTFIGPPALIAYAVVGFYLTISDGTNSDNVGIITNIDPNTSIVTVEHSVTNAYLSVNTLVRMTIRILDELIIERVGVRTYGGEIIGGAAIPKGTVARFIYKNNSITSPSASIFLQLICLY
jgi:hypothetical protein